MKVRNVVSTRITVMAHLPFGCPPSGSSLCCQPQLRHAHLQTVHRTSASRALNPPLFNHLENSSRETVERKNANCRGNRRRREEKRRAWTVTTAAPRALCRV